MADMHPQARYLSALIERIRADHYPSIAQMDLVEASLPPELIGPYVDVLMEKVEGDHYPSLTMLRRIERLAAQVPVQQSG